MIAPADQAPSHWSKPAGAFVSAPKTAFFKETVCQLHRDVMTCRPEIPSDEVMQALGRLVAIVMQLRSPTGGWPADLPQTPENLLTYVGEEIWELIDALDQDRSQPTLDGEPAPVMVSMTALVPHLLWLLASSNYEVMRLLEGVRSRIYAQDNQFSVGVVRLVPVLHLTAGSNQYALDLVTQAEPDTALFLTGPVGIKLVENDLDDQPMAVSQMLAHLRWAISQTKPLLSQLLEPGWQTQALSPFQPWEGGSMQLQLYLAKMEKRQRGTVQEEPLLPAEAGAAPPLTAGNGHPQQASSGFTLDDFAEVLAEDPPLATSGILGDWLTFTNETWVHHFLKSCAQEVMLQHLPRVTALAELAAEERELCCMELVYAATSVVQGHQALSNHTFVHEPTLVADVWLRLRWYLAHCSERIMQFMGGLSTRVLVPGRGWQRGYLYLRPIMTLTGQGATAAAESEPQSWMLDLGSGRLLPTLPQTLPDNAVVALVDDRDWQSPLTVLELTNLINQDVENYAPAMAALKQGGTQVNLHRLESEEGRQQGQLSLDWGFTLQTAL